MGNCTIGMAEAAGVRRDTIRYYERAESPIRTGPLQAIAFTAKTTSNACCSSVWQGALASHSLRSANFLSLRASDSARASDLLRVTEKEIDEEEARITQFKAIKDALEVLAAECRAEAPVSDCPIVAHISIAARYVSGGRS